MEGMVRPTAGYRTAKVVDIGYVGTVYILLAFGIGVILNNHTPRFDPVVADRRSWWSLLAEVVLHFWVLNVLVYAVRKMVEVLPWPDFVFSLGEQQRRLDVSRGWMVRIPTWSPHGTHHGRYVQCLSDWPTALTPMCPFSSCFLSSGVQSEMPSFWCTHRLLFTVLP